MSTRRQRLCHALLTICVLSRCTQPEPVKRVSVPMVVMDTTAGMIVVRNPVVGQWLPGEEWVLKEEFRVGGAEATPEASFTGDRMSVSVGPHGHIFVMDFLSADMKVFSGDGKFLFDFGGPGQEGPADLNRPWALGWDRENRLWIANAFSGWYSVFDSSGVLIKTVPRQSRANVRWQYRLVFVDAASFVDETGGAEHLTLLQVDTAGQILDTFPPLRFPKIDSQVLSTVLPPGGAVRQALKYLPRLRWAVAADGTVWMANTGELKLIHRTLRGDTLRVVETQHRRTTLTRGDEDILRRGFAEIGVDRSEVLAVRPVVQSIHVLDDGHVLVQIEAQVGVNSNLLDVFDPEGRFLGSVQTSLPLAARHMPAIRGDTLIVVATGELDVPYLIRYTLRRPATSP